MRENLFKKRAAKYWVNAALRKYLLSCDHNTFFSFWKTRSKFLACNFHRPALKGRKMPFGKAESQPIST